MAAETIGGVAEPFETCLNETATAEDIGEAALSAYARAVGEEPSRELLVRRGFMSKRSERLTNAGTLLFARRPGEHIVRAEVMVEVRAAAQRETLKKRGWETDRLFDEPLVTLLPVIESYLDELLRPYAGDSYPRYAWREGLVNAIAHRDYELRGDYTSLSILEGRIEIANAGSAANGLPAARIREAHYSRNTVLVRALTELGWMHDLGVGINGIYDSMGGIGVHYSVSREFGSDHIKLTLMSQKRGGFRDMTQARHLISMSQQKL